MSVVRVVFLGTPDIAAFCLESMLSDEHFKIVGVVSQPDRASGRKLKLHPSPVKELALAHHLPLMTPENFKDSEVLNQISSWKAEAAVVVAYGQILPQAFLDLYPMNVVNIHTSLLPRWRGAAPIQRAIMAGDRKTGVCLQVMVKKLDAGDVIGKRSVDIHEDMDAVELLERMKPLASDLLHVEFMDYLRGNLVPHPQDESLVTYAKKVENEESLIDWNLSAREIRNRMRGLALGRGIYTWHDHKKLKLTKTQVVSNKMPAEPGEVVVVGSDYFEVATGGGILRVSGVQPESRSQMGVDAYLRGYTLKVGDRLGEHSF
ncbi:MAG: methionyl-tRNA formyltransferase [Bdellovibrionales bacterium]|nr:methionyl-tRNA formyltransferase [Bdellovibrionales bacterium]